MTNNERAARAQNALDHAKAGEIPDEADVSDLIGDLLHLARQRSKKRSKNDQVEYALGELERARMHFEQEATLRWDQQDDGL